MDLFDKIYYKHMFEKTLKNTPNAEEVGKRVEDELGVYIDSRKEELGEENYVKIMKMVKDITTELDPDTIFDDLMEIGEIIGLKDSFSRVVGKVITIVDELENEETFKADVIGEPEAEPEEMPVNPEGEEGGEPAPEGEEGGEDDLDLGMGEPEGEKGGEDDLDLGMGEPEGEKGGEDDLDLGLDEPKEKPKKKKKKKDDLDLKL
jgi:hypothetical protein